MKLLSGHMGFHYAGSVNSVSCTGMHADVKPVCLCEGSIYITIGAMHGGEVLI